MPSSGWINLNWKLEHDPISMEGYIWSDEDRNNNYSDDEDWSSNSSLPCSDSGFIHNFQMTYTGAPLGNRINSWECDGNTTKYKTANELSPGSSQEFELTSIPPLYLPERWQYLRVPLGSVNEIVDSEGLILSSPFRTSSIFINETDSSRNIVWEIKPMTYALTITVEEINPELVINYDGSEPSCQTSDITRGTLQGVNVSIYPQGGGPNFCDAGALTDSNGQITCNIPFNRTDLTVVVSKDDSSDLTPDIYSLKCPCEGSGVGCDVTIPPDADPLDDEFITVGMQAQYKYGWISAVDSDIFANNLRVDVPAGPTDNSVPEQVPYGFSKTLINSSSNNINYLGFTLFEDENAFDPEVNKGDCMSNKMFENDTSCNNLGGFAYNLLINGEEHDSVWLENFTFAPPSNSQIEELTSLPSNTQLSANTVYKIRYDNSDDWDLSSYTITNGPGVPIIYVEGDINIDSGITNNTPDNGRLLIVVLGNVFVNPSVGTDISSFNMSNRPNIEAGIIASGRVEFSSGLSDLATIDSHDDPIMVSAPLISRDENLGGGIVFSRDLYHDFNAVMPSVSSKAYSKYLYYISSLEKDQSLDSLYFTGIATFNVDWEYIY
jgi:hypothetical protein